MAGGTPLRSLARDTSGVAIVSSDVALGLAAAEKATTAFAAEMAAISNSYELTVELSEVMGNPRELDPARANLLRALTLPAEAVALEVGPGWGSLTRYLGERVRVVDALTSDPSSALITRARVTDLENVQVFAGRIDDIPDDSAYDLVVISDLDDIGWSSSNPDEARRGLALLATRLAPGGRVALVATNRLGVKRQAGGTDREAIAGAELEAGEQFSVTELEQLFTEAGLAPASYGVFPDQWSPRVVMNVPRLRMAASPLVLALPSFPSPDPAGALPRTGDEADLWASWVASGLGADVVNAVLIVAESPSASVPLWPSTNLATYWSAGRSTEHSAENSVELNSDGTVHIRREHLADRAVPTDAIVTLAPSIEQYVDGDDFVREVAVARGIDEVQALLARWIDLVDSKIAAGGPVLWDLVPHNLILRGDTVNPIDQEWVLAGDDWHPVIRRGIFWLASRLAERRAVPEWFDGDSIADGAIQLGELVGLAPESRWLEDFYFEEAVAVSGMLKPDPRYTQEERIPQIREQLTRTGSGSWHRVARPPTLAESYVELRTQTGESRVMERENMSITQSIGRTRVELVAREAELAERESELVARDARIEALETSISDLRVEEQHTALKHRDHVVGLQAQLVTANTEVHALGVALLAANATIEELTEKNSGTIAKLRSALERTKASLAETRTALRKERATSKSRAQQIRALKSSRTWRIGSAFLKPLSIFKR